MSAEWVEISHQRARLRPPGMEGPPMSPRNPKHRVWKDRAPDPVVLADDGRFVITAYRWVFSCAICGTTRRAADQPSATAVGVRHVQIMHRGLP